MWHRPGLDDGLETGAIVALRSSLWRMPTLRSFGWFQTESPLQAADSKVDLQSGSSTRVELCVLGAVGLP
jgi:hypothetical protein